MYAKPIDQKFISACEKGESDKIEKLLKKGADIYFGSMRGFSLACQNGNTDVIQILLNHIDFNNEEAKGNVKYSFSKACSFGHLGCAMAIANSNLAQNEDERVKLFKTAMFIATDNESDSKILEFAIENIKQNHNILDIIGDEIYSRAATFGKIDIYKYLFSLENIHHLKQEIMEKNIFDAIKQQQKNLILYFLHDCDMFISLNLLDKIINFTEILDLGQSPIQKEILQIINLKYLNDKLSSLEYQDDNKGNSGRTKI